MLGLTNRIKIVDRNEIKIPDPLLYFWNAEREMYCEGFTVDVSQFDTNPRNRARILRFLPSTSVREDFKDQPVDGLHDVRVTDVIQPGHGVVVYW